MGTKKILPTCDMEILIIGNVVEVMVGVEVEEEVG